MSGANSTLTLERLKEILSYDPETGVFVWIKKPAPRANRIKVGDIAGQNDPSGYIRISIDGKQYWAQRLALLYVNGQWPTGEADHMDGNRANNRIDNLRDVPKAMNVANKTRQSKNNTSSALGVYHRNDTGRFSASIMIDRKRHFLGCFETLDEASLAYKAARQTMRNEN